MWGTPRGNRRTYFRLEEAYIILIHTEAEDVWSSQAPEICSQSEQTGQKFKKTNDREGYPINLCHTNKNKMHQ